MDSLKFYTKKQNVLAISILCTFLWGSAYPSIKIGYELFHILPQDIPSKLIFAGFRFTLAGIMVLAIFTLINKSLQLPSKNDFPRVLLLGFTLTTLQYIFFYIGLSNTTGVQGAILNSTGAFFSVILAHYIYKNDKLNHSKILGCIIGFMGIIVLNFSTELLNFDVNLLGDGFIILAALISSSASIYSKKLSDTVNTMVLTGTQLFLGGVLLTFLGYITGGHLEGFTISSTLLLLYMGALSAAAFTLWTYLLKYNKVGSISMYNFLIPIFGAVLSSLFLRESFFHIKNLLALLLVSMGIYIVNKGKLFGKEGLYEG